MNEKDVRIGCSGYYYKHWIGKFYKEGTRPYKFFDEYIRFFDTVELNSTFYHYPTEKQVESWIKKSPENFLFSVKMPRLITHRKLLKDCEDNILLFLHLIKPLKQQNKLGVILIQTPKGLKYDIGLLNDFMDLLPHGYRYAFEFRNKEYYNDNVFKIMRDKKMDMAYISGMDYIPNNNIFADFKYYRMHGIKVRYASDYTDTQLLSIANDIKKVLAKGINNIFVYFNNDYNAYAPKNALRLKEILAQI